MSRRVVVTGIGAITPLGCDCETMWKNLIAGESGIRNIDTFDTSDIPSKVAGLLPNDNSSIATPFDPDKYMAPSEQRKVDTFIIYAMAAAAQAYEDAGFESLSEKDKESAAVIIGSGIGGVSRLYETSVTLHESGARRVSPFFIPSVLVNLASGFVSIKYGFKGASFSVVSACSSGNHSVGEAFKMIRSGETDYALAGGAESAVCRLGVAGFAAARALSTSHNDTPTKSSRPWDKGRDGFVIGEGGGVLALETLEGAKARGAKIHAEIVGYGSSCDAFHITAPSADGLGATLSMERALKDAGITTKDIGYINAHGTSTPQGDIAEIHAIKRVFKEDAYNVNVSSTKSAIGHLLGASGSVESIISILAIRDSVCPPTLNLETPDEGCDINLTANVAQKREIEYSMNNSFGFGGTNSTLIFKKV